MGFDSRAAVIDKLIWCWDGLATGLIRIFSKRSKGIRNGCLEFVSNSGRVRASMKLMRSLINYCGGFAIRRSILR